MSALANNDRPNLGLTLLVAMDNEPPSLELVRTLSRELDEPVETHLTLIHYLTPIFWEHGGGNSPEAQAEIRRQEEAWLRKEQQQEVKTIDYFQEACAILQAVGVPATNIRTKMRWDADDVSDAILTELKDGYYTGVVVGRRHHDLLTKLLGLSLADSLAQHTKRAKVWVVEEELDEATRLENISES